MKEISLVPIFWLKAPGHDGTFYSLLPTANAQPSTTVPNFMVMSRGGGRGACQTPANDLPDLPTLSQCLRAARSAKQEVRTLESLVPTPLSSSLSRRRVAAPSAYTERQVSVNICSRRLDTQKPESSLPIFFIHARILYFLTPDPSQKLKLCTRHSYDA